MYLYTVNVLFLDGTCDTFIHISMSSLTGKYSVNDFRPGMAKGAEDKRMSESGGKHVLFESRSNHFFVPSNNF